MNTLRERIINRFTFRRNGNDTPSFSQASPIAMAGDDRPPTLETEYASVTRQFSFSPGLGLMNNMPVLSAKGLEIVDTMMTDDAVGTGIELKKVAALSTPWSWEAASDEPEHQQHAAYLTEVFDKLDSGEEDQNGINIGVVNKLRDMLSAIEYGFSITNVKYSLIDTGEFKGKLGLADMKTKPPHHFGFETDDFLNLLDNGIVYNGEGHAEHLPADAFIVYSYRAKFGNPYGYSDCIRVYDRWNSKRYRQKFWDIYLERHGCGTWDASFDRKDVPSPQEQAQVVSFLKGAQAKSAIYHSDRVTLKPHEPQAGSSDMWLGAIGACNTQIFRGLFFPDLVGFSAQQDSGGAYALGKKHFDFLLMIIGSLQVDLAGRMKLLGRRLVTASFGPQVKYPNFVFAPLTDEQKLWWISTVITAVEKGVLVADETVIKKVREVLDLPEQDAATQQDNMPVSRGTLPGDEPADAPPEAPQPPMPEDMAELVERIAGHERVIVVGGPRTGKTLFAVAAAYKHGRSHRHTDSLVGALSWSEASAKVAEWFADPRPYIIEGVATVRAIRKWLLANPDVPLPATIVYFDMPRIKLSAGQDRMRKATATIWDEIEPELVRRGATIIRTR